MFERHIAPIIAIALFGVASIAMANVLGLQVPFLPAYNQDAETMPTTHAESNITETITPDVTETTIVDAPVANERDTTPQKGVTSPTRDLVVIAADAPVVAPGSQLVSNGRIAQGWLQNSWGVLVAPSEKGMRVQYRKSWDAFSLFGSGFTVGEYRAVTIAFARAPQAIDALHLSLFDGAKRLGTIALAPYRVTDTTYTLPLAAFTTAATITDVALESGAVGAVELVALQFTTEKVAVVKQVVIEPTPVPAQEEVVVPSPAPAPVVVPAITAPEILVSGLRNGWTIDGRGVEYDAKNDERSITGFALKFMYPEAGGRLTITHQGGMNTKGFDVLRLRLYGGITDHQWQQLYVTMYDREGNKLGTSDIMGFNATAVLQMRTWNEVRLPLHAFGGSGVVIKTIDIENVNRTQVGDAMWLDDLRFE